MARSRTSTIGGENIYESIDMDGVGVGVTIANNPGYAFMDIGEGEDSSPRLSQGPVEEGSKESVYQLQENEAYAVYH